MRKYMNKLHELKLFSEPYMHIGAAIIIMASVHKFPAVKTGRQGEFGAGS
jgi:hypothetical protein